MPKKVDHEARREAFLEAAGRLVLQNGLAGLTVRAVAREAGFTTGALVHYVNSVDDLLIDAFDYAGRGVRARMTQAEAHPDPLVSLREVFYLALPNGEAQLGNWTYWLGFWERSAHNPALRKITHFRYARWLKRAERLIRRARLGGALASDMDIARAARSAVALLDGIAAQVLCSGNPPSQKQQRALIDDWIRFRLPPAKPKPARR